MDKEQLIKIINKKLKDKNTEIFLEGIDSKTVKSLFLISEDSSFLNKIETVITLCLNLYVSFFLIKNDFRNYFLSS